MLNYNILQNEAMHIIKSQLCNIRCLLHAVWRPMALLNFIKPKSVGTLLTKEEGDTSYYTSSYVNLEGRHSGHLSLQV